MRKVIDRTLISLLVALMSIMVLSTLIQVFARALSANVLFTEELTIYSMMWVTLFGSAYAFGVKKHISIDILKETLRQDLKWKLEVVVELIVALFAILVLIVGGSWFVFITFKLGQVSSVIQVPKGWIYLALPVSGVIILIYNALNIMDTIRKN
ncbi:MAG: TRAP transporter small permease [Cyclobacteriaceae bacterium]